MYYRLIEALETAQLNGVFKIAGVRAKWEVKKLNSSEKLANHSQIMMKVEVDSLIAKKSEPIVVKKDNKSVVHEEQLDLPGPSCSSSKFLLPTKRQHQTNVQPYNSGSESDPSEYSKEELLVAAIGPKSSSNQIQYMGEKNNTLIKTNLSKLFAKSYVL